MAIQETGRDKQVYTQTARLDNAIAALREVAVNLDDSLKAVLSPDREDEEKTQGTTKEALCEHADFLRSRTSDITVVTRDLTELISRLEI